MWSCILALSLIQACEKSEVPASSEPGAAHQTPLLPSFTGKRLMPEFTESNVDYSPLSFAPAPLDFFLDIPQTVKESDIETARSGMLLNFSEEALTLTALREHAYATWTISSDVNLAIYDIVEIETVIGAQEPNGKIMWKDRENGEFHELDFIRAARSVQENGRVTFAFDLYRDDRWREPVAKFGLKPFVLSGGALTVHSIKFRSTNAKEQCDLFEPLYDYPAREPSPYLKKISMADQMRNALVAPPSSGFSWRTTVPENASMTFGLNAAFDNWRHVSDVSTLDFSITATVQNGEKEQTSVIFKYDCPVSENFSGEWIDKKVSLNGFSGKDVTFTFTTSLPNDLLAVNAQRMDVWGFWSFPGISSSGISNRNILYVSIDCLRTDRVHSFGYERETTPFIDSLARKGVMFENMYSQAAITCTSHMSMLTGLYPVGHGVTCDPQILPESVVSLAQQLRNEGYLTLAIVGGGYLSRDYGHQRGFDLFDDRNTRGEMPLILPILEDLMDVYDQDKLFVFIHTFDAHEPYVTEPEYTNFFDPGYTGPVDPAMILTFMQMANNAAGVDIDFLASDRFYECTNLVKNHNFESTDWMPMPNMGLVRSGKGAHKGEFCGYLESPITPGNDFSECYQDIPVRPNEQYLYGGYIRADGLKSEAAISLIEDVADQYASTARVRDTTDWQFVVGAHTTSSRCRTLRFIFPRVKKYTEGSVWVDDLFLIPYNAVPAEFRTMKYIGEEETRRLNDIYDGSVRYTDDHMKRMMEILDAHKFMENGVAVFTADHGQDLMDHGFMGHGRLLSWDSVLRVPFVLYAPTLYSSPKRYKKYCESVDISPTLLNIAGVIPDAGIQGLDLFSPVNNKNFIFASYAERYTIISREHRFFYDAETTAVDLNIHAIDPGQHDNVQEKHPEIVSKYMRILQDLLPKYKLDLKAKPRAVRDISPELISRLRALGYL